MEKPLKNVKLIASDLDNTLLLDDGSLPDDFYDLVKKLYENNVIFCPASGRPYSSLKKMFSPVLDQVVCIADNGGNVKFKDETIFLSHLSQEEIKRFLDFTYENTNGIPVLMTPGKTYIPNEGKAYHMVLGGFIADLEYVDDLYEIEDNFNKFTIYFPDKTSIQKSDELYKPIFGDDYDITTGDDYFIDIMENNVNKGRAIIEIGNKFGITTDEMMAFGDHLNDKAMVETAYFGYCVANANERLKEIARFETLSNTEEGVIREMKKVLEEKTAVTSD